VSFGRQIFIVVFLSTQQELFVSKGTNTTQLLFKRRARLPALDV
jgi:hypothetical protein